MGSPDLKIGSTHGQYDPSIMFCLDIFNHVSILFLCFVLLVASVVSEMPPVASTPPASVGVTPVAVVSVPTVTATVTAVQTMPLLHQSLPPGLPVGQPAAAIPAFPPVMVPPFRVPLPGMHIPLPGT